jgi:hypothetical protein
MAAEADDAGQHRHGHAQRRDPSCRLRLFDILKRQIELLRIELRPIERLGDIIAQPILGDLHYRYARI